MLWTWALALDVHMCDYPWGYYLSCPWPTVTVWQWPRPFPPVTLSCPQCVHFLSASCHVSYLYTSQTSSTTHCFLLNVTDLAGHIKAVIYMESTRPKWQVGLIKLLWLFSWSTTAMLSSIRVKCRAVHIWKEMENGLFWGLGNAAVQKAPLQNYPNNYLYSMNDSYDILIRSITRPTLICRHEIGQYWTDPWW